jgi:hypothetical protein
MYGKAGLFAMDHPRTVNIVSAKYRPCLSEQTTIDAHALAPEWSVTRISLRRMHSPKEEPI